MNKSKALHYSLGDRFGQTLTDIAQEHIQYNYNLQKGIDAIEKGLVGIPRELVIEILSGNQVISVKNDECIVSERHEGHDVLGYKTFNASKWSDIEIEKLVKSGDNLGITINNAIQVLKYKHHGHFNIDFESSALMKYIFHGDDSEIFMKIEDEMDTYRQLQLVVDAYIKKANTTLNCITDLYKLSKTEECKGKGEWVIDIPPTLQVILNIKMQIKELLAITKEDNNSNIDNTSMIDKYLSAQRDIDVIEKGGIQVVNIIDNYTAMWLAPNGDAYGLNGERANMLHNQMADMLKEANIIDCGDNNPDSHMMELGWLKLHNGEVLGDHVYHEIVITEAQKKELIKYVAVQRDYVIYINHKIMQQYISKSRLEMTSLEILTNMLDIGMKKKDLEIKERGIPSVKDVRDNPMFK